MPEGHLVQVLFACLGKYSLVCTGKYIQLTTTVHSSSGVPYPKYIQLTTTVHSSPGVPYPFVGSNTSLAFAVLSSFAGQLLCFVWRGRRSWANEANAKTCKQHFSCGRCSSRGSYAATVCQVCLASETDGEMPTYVMKMSHRG